MKNRRFPHPAACFFLLTVLAAFTSWVGTVYEWAGVRSLLGDEGFRWTLRAVGGLYLHSPLLPAALVLFLGAGPWRLRARLRAFMFASSSWRHGGLGERQAVRSARFAGLRLQKGSGASFRWESPFRLWCTDSLPTLISPTAMWWTEWRGCSSGKRIFSSPCFLCCSFSLQSTIRDWRRMRAFRPKRWSGFAWDAACWLCGECSRVSF